MKVEVKEEKQVEPLVSIVLLHLDDNQARLQRALERVMKQEYAEIEIIVVDARDECIPPPCKKKK